MIKVAFIIPGYGESHKKQSGYTEIAKFFANKNILPIQVEIDWEIKKKKNFKRYARQFIRQYNQQILPKDTEIYILGFSFGAVTALLSAPKIKPTALLLCSLSPYFKEDLLNLKPTWLKWYKNEFSNYISFDSVIKNVSTQAYFIVGDKEHKSCLIRAKDGQKKLKNSTLIFAKGAKHKIGQKEYLKTLKKVISKL